MIRDKRRVRQDFKLKSEPQHVPGISWGLSPLHCMCFGKSNRAPNFIPFACSYFILFFVTHSVPLRAGVGLQAWKWVWLIFTVAVSLSPGCRQWCVCLFFFSGSFCQGSWSVRFASLSPRQQVYAVGAAFSRCDSDVWRRAGFCMGAFLMRRSTIYNTGNDYSSHESINCIEADREKLIISWTFDFYSWSTVARADFY